MFSQVRDFPIEIRRELSTTRIEVFFFGQLRKIKGVRVGFRGFLTDDFNLVQHSEVE